jgi:hypothetical protein
VDHEHGPVEMMVVLNAMVIMAIVVDMVEVVEVEGVEVVETDEEVEIQITDVPMPIRDGVVLLLVEVLWEVVERRLTHAMVEVVEVIDMVAEAIHLVLETVIVIVVVVVLTLLVGEEEEHPPPETRLAPPRPRLLLLREKDHV